MALAAQGDTVADPEVRRALLKVFHYAEGLGTMEDIASGLVHAIKYPEVIAALLSVVSDDWEDLDVRLAIAYRLVKPIGVAVAAGDLHVRRCLVEYVFGPDGGLFHSCGRFSEILVSEAVSEPDFCIEFAARLFRALTDGRPYVCSELLELNYSHGLDY